MNRDSILHSFQILVRALPVVALLAGTPLGALANTVKDDVWRVTSVKVNGQDAIPNGLNNWKGPAGGPDTVNVEIVWEPGNGPWSHLADMCNPTHSPEPDAYLSVLDGGPSGLQGQAQMVGLSTEKFTFTYSGVPKNSEFYVYIKCEAPVFQPGTELLATFAFVDLKYKISVDAETIEQGGFDPYGAPEAGGVEVNMPGDPGKFPADSPKDYAIFIKAITTNPPQKIRGQFQKAADYQVGGYVGDLAMPSDKVYVSQWVSHPGPIDSPTDWDSLVYGGPSTIKGVMAQMGEGAQFGPGIYRVRVRAEDGNMQNWSDWWQFWVGDPTSVKSQLMSKADSDALDLMQGGGGQGNGNQGSESQMSAQFGDKATEIKSELGVQPQTGQLQRLSQGSAGAQSLGGDTNRARLLQEGEGASRNELMSNETMSMQELSGKRSTMLGKQPQATMGDAQDAGKDHKMAKIGNNQTMATSAANRPALQAQTMSAQVSGRARAGQLVKLQINAPHDAGNQLSIYCVSGDCAGQQWSQNMGSTVLLPGHRFAEDGHYTLKLQAGAYSTQVSFAVSPSMRATSTGNTSREMTNVNPQDTLSVQPTGDDEKTMKSVGPQQGTKKDARSIMMQSN